MKILNQKFTLEKMDSITNMKELLAQVGNNIKEKIFRPLLTDEDPELEHLRRMRRLRKFMGNISSQESRDVEIEVEKLAIEFDYPNEQVIKALEWLVESYGSDPLLYKENLRKLLKLSKTLGRSTCTSLKKEDLCSMIPPLLH